MVGLVVGSCFRIGIDGRMESLLEDPEATGGTELSSPSLGYFSRHSASLLRVRWADLVIATQLHFDRFLSLSGGNAASCHCVALDTEGRCYTWGRNEASQLGHGDNITRDRPTVVSELSKFKIVKAAAGRSHTVVVTDDGQSFAFGWNKHGQLIQDQNQQHKISDFQLTTQD
ncbi:Protein RCC2 [Capsicum baccatum]|uniref:Protein RCC2 n=1 Tax=Capsicum baccatum TaxID=33114 RepID=A0A2G2WU29_CAPBA|nr:Protein RCC2 [Capsicum baccatum]